MIILTPLDNGEFVLLPTWPRKCALLKAMQTLEIERANASMIILITSPNLLVHSTGIDSFPFLSFPQIQMPPHIIESYFSITNFYQTSTHEEHATMNHHTTFNAGQCFIVVVVVAFIFVFFVTATVAFFFLYFFILFVIIA